MTDPRNTDPRLDPTPGSNLNDPARGGGSMWGWIAGIAVVVLIAFIVAAFWNGQPRTASVTPTETTGMGTVTHTTPPPATTGRTPGAPAVAPTKPAPQPAPAGQ